MNHFDASRKLGGLNGTGYGSFINDPNAKLPEPDTSIDWSLMITQDGVTGPAVPNQLPMPALGVEQIDLIALQQMFPKSVVAPDGTVIAQNGRIILDPNRKAKLRGYWNDDTKTIRHASDNYSEWKNSDIYKPITPNPIDDIPEKDKQYWDNVNKEGEKLKQNMTDTQKELLAKLDAGQLFPKTKLVDESKHLRN